MWYAKCRELLATNKLVISRRRVSYSSGAVFCQRTSRSIDNFRTLSVWVETLNWIFPLIRTKANEMQMFCTQNVYIIWMSDTKSTNNCVKKGFQFYLTMTFCCEMCYQCVVDPWNASDMSASSLALTKWTLELASAALPFARTYTHIHEWQSDVRDIGLLIYFPITAKNTYI